MNKKPTVPLALRTFLLVIAAISSLLSRAQISINGKFDQTGAYAFYTQDPVTVTIASSIADALIFYTTDGSDPDPGSAQYAGAFQVVPPAEIRAASFSPDFLTEVDFGPATIAYIPRFTVTDLTPGGGGVVFDPPGGVYTSNAVVTVTATNAPGWTFLRWDGDISSLVPTTQFKVDGPKRVKAVFDTAITANVTGNPAPGEVRMWPASRRVEYGGVAIISAIPATNKYFFRWSIVGDLATTYTNSPQRMVVTNANPTMVGLFSSLPAGNFALGLEVRGDGDVVATPRQAYYAAGSTVSLQPMDKGMTFGSWSGAASGNTSPLLVTMDTNKTITAQFTIPPKVTITNIVDGQVFKVNTLIPVNVSTSDADGVVTSLNVFANDQLVWTSASAPFSLYWNPTEPGAYKVTVVAVDDAGGRTTSAPVMVAIKAPPRITTQVTPIRAQQGADVNFTLSVDGSEALMFQWFHNGTNLPGSVYRNLYMARATPDMNGTYQVTITNEVGSATSDLVTLTVVPPGGILSSNTLELAATSAPAVGADGTAYLSINDTVQAFSKNGIRQWRYVAVGSQDVVTTPVSIWSDGTLFVGTSSGQIVAIDPVSGTNEWRYSGPSRVETEIAIGADGMLYFGCLDKRLYAVRPGNPTAVWSFLMGTNLVSGPTIGPDGTIYANDKNFEVYALKPDGSQKWKVSLPYTSGTPVPTSFGTVVVSRGAEGIVALNTTDGSQKWMANPPVQSFGTPVIGPGGILYVGTYAAGTALDVKTGATLWQKAATTWPAGAVVTDGALLYFFDAGAPSTLSVFNSSGALTWTNALNSTLTSSPILTREGLIYFTTQDGKLNVMVAEGPLANSDWPMARKAPGNHGNASGIPGDFRFRQLTLNNPVEAPSIDANGTVYTAFDARLHGFAHGTDRFDEAMQWLDDTPVVGSSGRVFVATFEQYDPPLTTLGIYDPIAGAFTKKAHVPGNPAGFATLALGLDETMYVGTSEGQAGHVYSWKEGNDPVLIKDLAGAINQAPVIYTDGDLLVAVMEQVDGLNQGRLYKLRTDGTVAARFDLPAMNEGDGIFGGPIVSGDGTIFICDLYGAIWALESSLHVKWQKVDEDRPGYRIDTAPAIGPDGTIYFAVQANQFEIIAYDPAGNPKWTQPFEMPDGATTYSSMAIGQDKTIYLGANFTFFAVRDAGTHGELAWKAPIGNEIMSSPLIAPDGNVYFSVNGGQFTSFRASSGPANSAWPMYRGNAQRTANARAMSLNPTVAIIAPTNGTICYTPTNITITAAPFTPSGTITSVKLLANSVPLATLTAAPWSFVATNAPVGLYTLTAVVTDSRGRTGTSDPVSVTVSLPTADTAVFKWAQTNYTATEATPSVTLSILKTGAAAADISFVAEQADGETGAIPGKDFLASQGTVHFSASDTSKTISIQLLDEFVPDGTKVVRVRLQSANVSQLGDPTVAYITISDDDAALGNGSFLDWLLVGNRPDTRGRLQMYLEPTAAGGQWRFPWELLWRNSGDIVSDLDPGDYPVEFRARVGYVAPTTTTYSIPGGVTVVRTNSYTADASVSGGSLAVQLVPGDLIASLNPGWRFVGDTTYRTNGETVANIPAGVQVVEFKAIGGWVRPTSREVLTQAGVDTTLTATYTIDAPPSVGVATPNALPSYNAIHTSQTLSSARQPFALVGQLRSAAGYGSGVAVRENVVLTAAHVLFDEATLNFVPSVDWFGERQAGEYEPRPISAIGYYVHTNYFTNRVYERNTLGMAPGQASALSRQWDFAAIYFDQPVAHGGRSGYLFSDLDNNEWLLSTREKELIGYPLNGVTDGKMHYVQNLNYLFTHDSGRLFSTADFLSYAGNSGGPLCVLYSSGNAEPVFFPAAVYLGNQDGRSIARVIDSDVASLINRAASSASLGVNFAGGGVITIGGSGGFGTVQLVHLKVQISPANAVTAGAAWRLQGGTTFQASGATLTVPPGAVTIEFAAANGFTTPTPKPITLVAGQDATVNMTYAAGAEAAHFESIQMTGNTVTLRARRSSAGAAVVEKSSDLTHWSDVQTINLSADTSTQFQITVADSGPGFFRLRNSP